MFKKILVYVLALFSVLVNLLCVPFATFTASGQMLLIQNNEPNFFERIIDLMQPFFDCFGGKKENMPAETPLEPKEVYVSGCPIGFGITGKGVVVVEISKVETYEGVENPTEKSDVKIGDVLFSIAGTEIKYGEQIGDIINAEQNKGKELEIVVKRDGKEIVSTIKPAIDALTGSYKLGLWVRDNAVGVGTMTFITENGDYGALGHPIADIDTGTIMPVGEGFVYKCSIVGVNKGTRGIPGELKGLFMRTENSVGNITKNCENGVYGTIKKEGVEYYKTKKVLVENNPQIGKVQILCTVDGSLPDYYDAEIIKTNVSNGTTSKNMVIRITDSRLLAKTGGIVQGMSGSPVLQDGKFVGTITHVFINDPTKGFASYAETMLNCSKL